MTSATETWSLRLRGATLSRIELLSADAVVVARIRPIDATRTEVEVVDGRNLWIDQWIGGMQIGDGVVTVARASDDVLTVGPTAFEWRAQAGRPRSLAVRSKIDAATLLEIQPGRSGPSQWATLKIHHDLPEPLALAALASAAMLRSEPETQSNGSWGWTSAGPA